MPRSVSALLLAVLSAVHLLGTATPQPQRNLGLTRTNALEQTHRAKSPESHVLRPRQLQRAVYLGDLERIRSFMWRMAAGERLTVALLGGSVTMGMGAVVGEPSYAQWLQEYLLDAHPPDLVLLEYAINDPPFPQPAFENEPRKSLELLLRKLLLLPGRPAVALLNGYRWQGQFILPGPAKRDALGVYYSNAGRCQDRQLAAGAVAFPVLISPAQHAAVYHQMVAGVRSFRTRANATSDKVRGTDGRRGVDRGRAMAELIIGMLVKVGRGLVMRPWRQSEESVRLAPLPRHLIPGNEDSVSDVCILGDRLRDSAVEQNGFAWVNEGRDPRAPKWGFTATQPGANITFVLNTTAPASDGAGFAAGSATAAASNATAAAAAPAQKPRFVILILAYLRSYENMGMADIHCAGGCVCGTRALALYDKYGGENGTSAMAPAAAAQYAAAVAAAAAEAQTGLAMAPAARLDGLWEPRASQLQLGCVQALLMTAPAGQAPGAGTGAAAPPDMGSCRVLVRVAQDTRSGAHKSMDM
eukprot:XP_001694497.1 predicted protein [Chlamydomonas reinhardtii]